MSSSTVTDMNLGGSKPISNGSRRKQKGSEMKKHKQPQRGVGMEQLERQRKLEEWKMKQVPFSSFNPPPPPLGFITTSGCTSVQNVAVQFRHPSSPGLFVPGIGIHGPNLYPTDVMHPSGIGLGNGGFRFENSINNYVKCGLDGCGVCHKKKRISGGSNNCSVTPIPSFCDANAVMEMIGAGKTHWSSGQVTEVMPVNRNGGGSMTEYKFFPGKDGGEEEDYKEWIRMGTTAATWCGSGGGIGLRGGEGSCVTAVTGSEEGSVSSVDLSLKLSY